MLAYIDQVDDRSFPGVATKITAQINAFKKKGIECERINLPYKRDLFIQLLRRMPFMPDWYGWNSIDISKWDAFYIRKPYFFSPSFISFLRRIKTENHDAKVLLELPTYPYDDEMKGFFSILLLMRDRVYRKMLHKYIDRIVSFSAPDCIFDIPTISIFNGIDVSKVEMREPSYDEKAIRLLCLATFAKWHGADRLIEGIAEYYRGCGPKDITLYLIGDGPEIPRLSQLVRDREIENHVVFLGAMTEAQYKPFFDKCSAAVASLGLHRIGISYASTLKTREYLARGIPFIFSGKIDVFEKAPVDFCLQIPADDSPVDINNVLLFLDGLSCQQSSKSLAARIRGYAIQHVDMESVFDPVVSYVKGTAGL